MRLRHYQIEVQGRGYFPVDMLRYSQCYPRDAESVENITRSGVRNITLCLDYSNEARADRCIKRFESFGWNGEIVRRVS
jgi:hypothetical protein